MLNTDNIDKQAVFAAENSFAEMFKNEGLDAAPGTALRELVVRPSAVNRAIEEEWRTNLLRSLNINLIADGTVSGDDDIVDAIASIYRIKRRTGSVSSGVIMLEVNGTNVYVNNNFSFYSNGSKLSFDGIWVGTLTGTGPVTQGVTYTKIITYPKAVDSDGVITYSQCMMLPVYNKDGASIASGANVEVVGPSGLILSASVFSPIVGGSSEETNQELASRVLNNLPAGVLASSLQITNTIGENFGRPPARTVVVGSQDGSKRSIDHLTGFRLPGFVDVYTAAPGDCQLESDVLEAVPTGVSQQEHLIIIEPPLSSGAYDIASVVIDGVAYTPTNIERSVTTSNHIIDGKTGAFSAYQILTVTIPYPGSERVSASVVVRKQAGIEAIQSFVDSSDKKAPGQDTLVKAACPVFLNVSFGLESGSSASISEIKRKVCEYINNLPVGRGFISGQDFTDALDSLGIKIAFPITIRAKIIDEDGVTHNVVVTNSRLDVSPYTIGSVFYLSESDLQVVGQ